MRTRPGDAGDYVAGEAVSDHASIRQRPLSRLYRIGGLEACFPLSNHIATSSGLWGMRPAMDT